MDPEVISALEASVEAQPASIPLRLHLAGLLLEAGHPTKALHHASEILTRDPGHESALAIVNRASAALAARSTATPPPPMPPSPPADDMPSGRILQWAWIGTGLFGLALLTSAPRAGILVMLVSISLAAMTRWMAVGRLWPR